MSERNIEEFGTVEGMLSAIGQRIKNRRIVSSKEDGVSAVVDDTKGCSIHLRNATARSPRCLCYSTHVDSSEDAIS